MSNRTVTRQAPQTMGPKPKAAVSLCDSCVYRYAGEHWTICDESIEEAEEINLLYVVKRCAAYEKVAA